MNTDRHQAGEVSIKIPDGPPDDRSGTVLEYGDHETREEGICLMELTACLAGEEHTDTPECTSPTLTYYATRANDTLEQEPRQKLIPLAQELTSANCPECEERRGVSIVMDTIRNDASHAMRELGMPEWADRLSNITELRAGRTMAEAMTTTEALTSARDTGRNIGQETGGTEEEEDLNLMTLARTFGAAKNTWPRSGPPDPGAAMMFSSMAALLAHTGPDREKLPEVYSQRIRNAIAVCPHREQRT